MSKNTKKTASTVSAQEVTAPAENAAVEVAKNPAPAENAAVEVAKNPAPAIKAVKLNGHTLTAIGVAIKNGANLATLKADTILAADFEKLNGTIQSLHATVADLLDTRRNTANDKKQDAIVNCEKVVKMHFDFLCSQLGSRTTESGITKGIYRTRYADFAVLGELFERCRIGRNDKHYAFSVFAASVINLLHEMLNGKTDMSRCDMIDLTEKASEQLHTATKERNAKAAETRKANKAAKEAAQKDEDSFKAYATTLIKSLSVGDNALYGKAIELIVNSHATTEEKRAIVAALKVDKSIAAATTSETAKK